MPLMVPLRTFSINGSFPLHKSFCFCAGDLAGLGLSLINRYNTKTPSRWWQLIHWIIHSNDSFRNRFIQEWNIALRLEMHDILHAIVMCITSVKMVLWSAVHLHHLFLNWVAFNTQSCSSSYAIRAQNRRWIACDSEREIALLVSNLRLGVLNAAQFKNRWWRFTANHRTVFTDVMRMTIACNISCSPIWDAQMFWSSFVWNYFHWSNKKKTDNIVSKL